MVTESAVVEGTQEVYLQARPCSRDLLVLYWAARDQCLLAF